MTEQTIKWLHERVEHDIPDQLAQAKRTLDRATIQFFGQLAFDFTPNRITYVDRWTEEEWADLA